MHASEHFFVFPSLFFGGLFVFATNRTVLSSLVESNGKLANRHVRAVLIRPSSLCMCCFGGRCTVREEWALREWGELAVGLAAPRAVRAAGTDYGNWTFALDVVSVVFASTTTSKCIFSHREVCFFTSLGQMSMFPHFSCGIERRTLELDEPCG